MTPAPDLFDDADLSEPVARAVRRIAVAGFQALWSGQLVTLGELCSADATGLTEAAEHLQLRGRIELSAGGRLIAVHGLCRRPTPHSVEHENGAINTWCALDAIGIPAALGIDACARTQCPACQTPLVVSISAGEPQFVTGAVLWYPEVICGHLVDDFCSGANLFCTSDHLDRWVGTSPRPGRPMTIDEVAEIGRQAWADAREALSSSGGAATG